MEIILVIICVCLFVFFAVVLRKLISLKRNIRHFSQELERHKDTSYRQPIKITDFDKDLVALAVKINEHADVQHRLSEEYEQRKRQLDTVISGISHDFRTPLTASLGYLQMIEKTGELSPKNVKYLAVAVQKNQYLKELSDEFFELTKMESNQEKLCLEAINVSNLLTEMLLEQYGWIEERNICAKFNIQDGIITQTDLHLFERILNNLLSNAKKYTANDFFVSLRENGESVLLCVNNSLSNVESVDIDRVFEPFYRMDARTAGGSGLGLYVVKLCCDRLGWNVRAELKENNIFSVKIIF